MNKSLILSDPAKAYKKARHAAGDLDPGKAYQKAADVAGSVSVGAWIWIGLGLLAGVAVAANAKDVIHHIRISKM